MARKSAKAGLPHALERAGALCLAFVNTLAPRRDDRRRNAVAPPSVALERYGDLLAWGLEMGAVGSAGADRLARTAAERPQDAATALVRAIELRTALLRIFTAVAVKQVPRPRDLDVLNAALRVRRVIPGGEGFRWDWAGEDALDRVLWAVAQSAAELLTGERLARVSQCASKGCRQLFVARSPRRLWCDMNTCGNRAKGKRHQKYLRQIRKGLAHRARSEGGGRSTQAVATPQSTLERSNPTSFSPDNPLGVGSSAGTAPKSSRTASETTDRDGARQLDEATSNLSIGK